MIKHISILCPMDTKAKAKRKPHLARCLDACKSLPDEYVFMYFSISSYCYQIEDRLELFSNQGVRLVCRMCAYLSIYSAATLTFTFRRKDMFTTMLNVVRFSHELKKSRKMLCDIIANAAMHSK